MNNNFNRKNVFSAQVQISPEDFSPISIDERKDLEKLSEPTTFWKDAWRRLKNNKIEYIPNQLTSLTNKRC